MFRQNSIYRPRNRKCLEEPEIRQVAVVAEVDEEWVTPLDTRMGGARRHRVPSRAHRMFTRAARPTSIMRRWSVKTYRCSSLGDGRSNGCGERYDASGSINPKWLKTQGVLSHFELPARRQREVNDAGA